MSISAKFWSPLLFSLACLFWINNSGVPSQQAAPRLSFQLRHQHAVTDTSQVVFKNIHDSELISHTLVSPQDPYIYSVLTSHLTTYKPSSLFAFHSARLRSSLHAQSDAALWNMVEISGPDATDRETLLALAKMTSNAYMAGPDTGWYNVKGFNISIPVGWEPNADGLRGHIFVSSDNSTVIISIKGTSAGWGTGGGGPTMHKDKLNDNLLFSCCCARVGPTWSTVCGCYEGNNRCDQECVEASLSDNSLYYSIGVDLYDNVSYMYPHSNIWVVGHSLGGAISSLLGATFGVPVVAFEAPAEKLAATRLHLPTSPSTQHITHIIHTADPIAMGICNGITSTCALAGYAMETRCHLGKVALYDTVTKLGWTVDIRTHSIVSVIDHLLTQELEWDNESPSGGEKNDFMKNLDIDPAGWGWWGGKGDEKNKPKQRIRRPVPKAEPQMDCMDCFNWEYGHWEK